VASWLAGWLAGWRLCRARSRVNLSPIFASDFKCRFYPIQSSSSSSSISSSPSLSSPLLSYQNHPVQAEHRIRGAGRLWCLSCPSPNPRPNPIPFYPVQSNQAAAASADSRCAQQIAIETSQTTDGPKPTSLLLLLVVVVVVVLRRRDALPALAGSERIVFMRWEPIAGKLVCSLQLCLRLANPARSPPSRSLSELGSTSWPLFIRWAVRLARRWTARLSRLGGGRQVLAPGFLSKCSAAWVTQSPPAAPAGPAELNSARLSAHSQPAGSSALSALTTRCCCTCCF